MEEYIINQHKIFVAECNNTLDVQKNIEEFFRKNEDILPKSKDALILLKPNLNNDMSALTGGTTDLRILVAVIKSLQERGYNNILIGDGPNTGAFHSKINVFSRLKITDLAKKFDVKTIDFNHAPSVEVDLTTNKAKVAKICLDCDFLINLPKIKTHTEAALSMSLKNLIGCFSGFQKREIHENFFENIIEMNKIIKPDFHIIDGLVAMEGDGPSTGTPRSLGVIEAGTNPFILDLFCAKMIGFDYNEVPYLKLAADKNFITKTQLEHFNKLELKQISLKKPKLGLLAKLLLRNFFIKLRYTKLLDPIFSSDIVIKILLSLNIRQDLFIKEEATINKIYMEEERCDNCGKCLDFCPLGLTVTSPQFNFGKSECIKCLYCFFVCPRDAIKVEGDLGYLNEHLTRYGNYMNKL